MCFLDAKLGLFCERVLRKRPRNLVGLFAVATHRSLLMEYRAVLMSFFSQEQGSFPEEAYEFRYPIC